MPKWGWPDLHLRFPDGHWLLHGLAYHAQAPPHNVLVAGFQQFQPADVTLESFCFPADGLMLYAYRAGAPHSSSSLLDFTTRRSAGWTTIPKLVLLSHDREVQVAIFKSHGQNASHHDAARSALHLLAMAMASRSPPAQRPALLHAATALLTPEELVVRGPAIRRLLELPAPGPPASVAPTAVIDKVRIWSPGNNGMFPREGEDPQLDSAPMPGFLWDDADVEGLVALLGNSSPALYVSEPDAFPRTLGDVALMALAWVWGLDPRLLVDRDLDAPWTDDERAGTATALQTWWSAHHAERFPQAFVSDPSHRSLLWITAIITSARPADRPLLTATCIAQWRHDGSAQIAQIPQERFVQILEILGQDPDLDALIRSWPCSGPQRRTLAIWQEFHEEQSPLTDLLRDTLSDVPTSPAAWHLAESMDTSTISGHTDLNLGTAYAFTATFPTQERLDILVTAAQQPVGSWPWNVAHQIALFGMEAPDSMDARLLEPDVQMRGSTHLARILAFLALADTRRIPPENQTPESPAGSTAGSTAAADADPSVRVCDEVAMALTMPPRDPEQIRTVPREFQFRPGPLAQRDAAIVQLRTILYASVVMARAASGLPSISARLRQACSPSLTGCRRSSTRRRPIMSRSAC